MNDVPVLGGDIRHDPPSRLKIHCTALLLPKSTTTTYHPKTADVTLTPAVFAVSSFCAAQAPRLSSFRTSLRKRRARSKRPPAASLTVSSVVGVFVAAINLLSRLAILAGQEGIEPPTPGFGD